MKLLHRYIFRQVFVASLFAVGLFVFVLVAGNAIREVLGLLAGGKIAWSGFFQLMLMLVLYVVSYALPLGILTAIMMVLGRLSAQREVVALKAAGLSLYHIAAPIFFLAVLGTTLSVMINFYYAPIAKRTFKESLTQVVKDNPLKYLHERVFIDDFPGYVIYVGGRDGEELKDFWIWELDKQDRVSVFFRADRARFSYDSKGEAMVLTLLNANGEKRHEKDPEDLADPSLPTIFFEEWSIRLPMDQILGESRVHRKLSMLTYGELLEARKKVMAEGSGEKSFLEQMKIQLQIQKNFAMAFSILSFALIGIPLGIRVGRAETYANLAIALGLAMVYYMMIVLITWLENQPQYRPDLLVWAPNLVFQGFGLYLLLRANKN